MSEKSGKEILDEFAKCEPLGGEKPAISVKDEATRIYWDEIKKLPEVMQRLSAHNIKQIFDTAVVPAIDEVRRLDRDEPKIAGIKNQ